MLFAKVPKYWKNLPRNIVTSLSPTSFDQDEGGVLKNMLLSSIKK